MQGWHHASYDEVWRETFRQVSVGLALVDPAAETVFTNSALNSLLGPDAVEVVRSALQPRLAALGDEPVIVPLDERVVARVEPVLVGAGSDTPHRCFFVYVLPPQDSDPLTGLASRSRLLSELLRLLGRRDSRCVELVMLDLDNFKEVNDRYGHLTGDEVLTAVADRLRGAVRQEDMVCRWGGDEFVVLLDEPGEGGAVAVCARIAAALTVPVPTRVGPMTVAASCASARARQGETPADLLDRADRRMYRQKRTRLPRSRGGEGSQATDADLDRPVRSRILHAWRGKGRPPAP